MSSWHWAESLCQRGWSFFGLNMADSDKLTTHSIQNYVSNPHCLTNSFLFLLFQLSPFDLSTVPQTGDGWRWGTWGPGVLCASVRRGTTLRQLSSANNLGSQAGSSTKSHPLLTINRQLSNITVAKKLLIYIRLVEDLLRWTFASLPTQEQVSSALSLFLVQLFFTQNVQLEGLRPAPWLNANIAN